jgi:hypothetical protein
MVTVLDAANLLTNYSSHDFLRDRGEVAGPEDERALVDRWLNRSSSPTFG